MLAYYAIHESRERTGPPKGICVLDPVRGGALIWDHTQGKWQYNPELVNRLIFDRTHLGRTESVDRSTAERLALEITGAESLPAETAIYRILDSMRTAPPPTT